MELSLQPLSPDDVQYLTRFFYRQVAPHLGPKAYMCASCLNMLGPECLDATDQPVGTCEICHDDITCEITKMAIEEVHDFVTATGNSAA